MGERIGGIITLKYSGTMLKAKGSFSWLVNPTKKEGVTGSDGSVHGYKESAQVPYIEGEITDSVDLDLDSLFDFTDGTVTLDLPNKKTVVLRSAWYASEGKGDTDEGKLECRFEGLSGEVI